MPPHPRNQGIIFAVSGERYATLARRAARSLRIAMPKAQVDLFTDQQIEDGVFDRIHPLEDDFFRPKIRALKNSRFDRTLYLDCDVVVVADISDLFDLLDTFDMAGALAVARGQDQLPMSDGLPRCAPLINSGVLAVRRTPETQAFLKTWDAEVRQGSKYDQPTLRRLLFHSPLRFCPVGMEYNLKALSYLDIWRGIHGAPRVLHVSDLNRRPPGDPMTEITMDEAIGPRRARQVRMLLEHDWTLGPSKHAAVGPIIDELRARAQGPRLQRALRRAAQRLRRKG